MDLWSDPGWPFLCSYDIDSSRPGTLPILHPYQQYSREDNVANCSTHQNHRYFQVNYLLLYIFFFLKPHSKVKLQPHFQRTVVIAGFSFKPLYQVSILLPDRIPIAASVTYQFIGHWSKERFISDPYQSNRLIIF